MPQNRRNRFRRGAKIAETVFVRLVYGFASGISVKAVSGSIGVSAKTVRGEFIFLRGLLMRPEFNKWHGTRRALLDITDPQVESIIKAAFIDVLAECYFNTTCHRNFRLGNRKALRCRACPVTERQSSPGYADEVVEIIHMIVAFYTRIGIRGEGDVDRLTLFRQRFIHAATVETARANTRLLANGLPDPTYGGELSVKVLIERLLDACSLESSRPNTQYLSQIRPHKNNRSY